MCKQPARIRLAARPRAWRMRPLALLCALVCATALGPAWADNNVEFNNDFLELGGASATADLSIFAAGNRVLAGDYRVDVLVNGAHVEARTLPFKAENPEQDATPCVTAPMLAEWGVNTAAFPALAAADALTCVDTKDIGIPDARISYQPETQKLMVSVPQAAMQRSARGAIDQGLWEQGVSAAMLNYQLNLAQAERSYNGHQDSSNTAYLGLRGGVNLGPWRLRGVGAYNRSENGRGQWQFANTYVERDLHALRGRLVAGDSNTPGAIFDGFQFRGVQLSSDDSMLPDSMRGYAPTIRGTAQSNATVTVRQNGYVIYTTYVAPGPFVIDDLYPMSGSGDLQVVVTEADGRQTKYTQPYSAVPTLQREGLWSYNATAGEYRSGYNGRQRPRFLLGTLARGFAHGITPYGGLLLSPHYQSAAFGAGINLGNAGAVSLDLSHATSSTERGASQSGQSLRLLYAKSFRPSSTDLRLLGYRYSTPGYRSFSESVAEQAAEDHNRPFYNRRGRIEGSLSQQLGSLGSVYLSLSQQTYWGRSSKNNMLQLGYSGSYKGLSYGINFNYSNDGGSRPNRELTFSLSLPLGDNASASLSASRDTSGQLGSQANLYGTAFEDRRLSYNVSASGGAGQDASVNASLSYLGAKGRVDLGRSQGVGYSKTNLSLAGGALAYAGGVSLGQELGETMAIVEIPGGPGIGIESRPGLRTDGSGTAVVPNLTPYRHNRIALDAASLPEGIDVKDGVTEVVPTRGAVLLTRFAASNGTRVLVTLQDAGGKPLPFGARVEDGRGIEKAMVGQDGETFLSSVNHGDLLLVRWGDKAADSCRVDLQLPVASEGAGMQRSADDNVSVQRIANATCVSEQLAGGQAPADNKDKKS
ncbi:fimbria/pilus outer membrane usher protein [Paraherbaspirillum soli]|uniref:Fimbria/pilus outer membrane usher protein n=1 Tax=Paraherbaspirillum soli TaxID=631222 RepID=A0ABW0ME56_9BURK